MSSLDERVVSLDAKMKIVQEVFRANTSNTELCEALKTVLPQRLGLKESERLMLCSIATRYQVRNADHEALQKDVMHFVVDLI